MRQKKKALLNIHRQMASKTGSLAEPDTLERAIIEDQVMVKRSPEIAAPDRQAPALQAREAFAGQGVSKTGSGASPNSTKGNALQRLKHLYEDVNNILLADFNETEAQQAFDILKRLEANGRRWLDAQTRADRSN